VLERLIVPLQFLASQAALFQRSLAHATYAAAPVLARQEPPVAEAIEPIELGRHLPIGCINVRATGHASAGTVWRPHTIDIDALTRSAQHLEALPASVARLAALMAADEPNIQDAVQVVALDQALTLRVIRAANSAASASAVPIATVREAVQRVGLRRVLSLAMAVGVQTRMVRALPEYGLTEGELWRHSVAAALAAESAQAFCRVPLPPETQTAALLHDVGKLVMARFLEPNMLRLLAEAREKGGLSSLRAESELLLVHHGELGGLIAQHWKLPECVVTGITHHHTPGLAGDIIADAVHLANVTAKHAGTGYSANEEDRRLDAESMERLGLTTDGFAALCDRVTNRLGAVLALYSV
jgi:HD-like signal output (HDOD) protein